MCVVNLNTRVMCIFTRKYMKLYFFLMVYIYLKIHILQNPAQMATHGSGFCPRFRNPTDSLLFPNNVAKKIRLEVENLPRQVRLEVFFFSLHFFYVSNKTIMSTIGENRRETWEISKSSVRITLNSWFFWIHQYGMCSRSLYLIYMFSHSGKSCWLSLYDKYWG